MKWQIQSAGQTYDRGDESIIYYDPMSGGTHLISEFAGYLIQKIAGSPLSTEQVIELLSSDIDAEALTELQTAVPDILNQLAELDIIQYQ
jgi:PqqD family protein of HPr-rel-A system